MTHESVSAKRFAAVGSADDLRSLEPIVIGLYSPFFEFWDRIDFSTVITTSTELDDAGETVSTEPKIIVGLGTDIFFSGSLFGNVRMRWQHK